MYLANFGCMKNYLITFCFFFGGFAFAQDLNFSFLKERPLKADVFFGVDQFDNTYYGLDNVLYKTTPSKTYQYQNLALGTISSVSIYNPLEIVVFYRDFNTVVILDKALNEIQKIPFLNKNITLVAKAGKNQLWLYNDDDQQLELYNYQTKTTIAKSQPQGIVLPFELKATANFAWIETFDKLLVFNNYGNLVNTYTFDFDDFTLLNNDSVLFNFNSEFFLADKNIQENRLKVSFKIENTSFANDKLYLFFNNRIFIYQLLKN